MTWHPVRIGLVWVLIAVGVILASCGESSDDSGDTAGSGTTAATEAAAATKAQGQSEPKPPPSAKKGIEIAAGGSQFGEVLFDADGRALYYFDKEKTSKPECYGACAAAWPPVFTKGQPVGKGAVKDQLLGTTKRKDGKLQATYDGRPLYYYVDEPAGQVLCHNVDEFGGLWLAIQPDGQPVP